MNFVYLSIISSSFIIIGYLPEIYFTIFQIKNVDSTKYSSTLWLLGGILGTVYSGLNNVWYEVTFPVHNSQKGVWFYVTTEYDAKNPRLINNVFKMVKLGTVNTYPINLIGQRIIK
jgi:hypothetical protein